jgi:aminoglycoside phosphotransferase (APT) family kinase protein
VQSDEAVQATERAAKLRGLDFAGARVLRIGENGVVALPAAGLLARVIAGADILDQVEHEITVARWLEREGIPVVEPSGSPVVVGDLVVAFWEYLRDAHSADLPTLAKFLQRLHRLRAPAGLLKPVEPFERFDARLAAVEVLTGPDRDLLRGLRDELAAGWQEARFELGVATVHGDAHMDNLLRTQSGRIAAIDLETVAEGPPEWDLTLTALYFECGWFTRAQYDEFAGTYGYDVRSSSAWPMLRGIRMVRMVTWLAQSAGDHPDRQAQLRHRLDTLRDGTAPTGWSGY